MTPRQQSIIDLLLTGKTQKEAAESLEISVRLVELELESVRLEQDAKTTPLLLVKIAETRKENKAA